MTALRVVVDADHVGRTDGLLRSPEVCARAGCSYRQLDFWARVGLVHPERAAAGSGTLRLFSHAETDVIRRMVLLTDVGLSPSVAAKVVRQGGDAWLSNTVRIHVSPLTVTILPRSRIVAPARRGPGPRRLGDDELRRLRSLASGERP